MEGKEHIHIEHPEAWQLLVCIDDRQVDYMLFAPQVAGSLTIGRVALTDASLPSLEDAFYDAPHLLNEYKQVRVVVRSPHFVLLPSSASDDDCILLARAAFPDDDGDAAVCTLPSHDVKVVWLMPRGLQAFLGRTLNYPVMCHHLSPLCEHFKALNRDEGVPCMFVNMNPGRMDLAIYRDGALVCANSYPFADIHDAAYLAMTAWRTHGMDQLADELQLMGDGESSAAITPLLREYVKQVMPAVYPAAAMRLGRNAMQAPLELVLLALCE